MDMKHLLTWQLVLLFTLIPFSSAWGGLEYDAEANKVEIYGPYIKYNVLKSPFTLGRHRLDPADFRLEAMSSGEEGAQVQAYVQWPRFFMELGELQIKDLKGKKLLSQSFGEQDLDENEEQFARLLLKRGSKSLLQSLANGFQICIHQLYQESDVKVCSDHFYYQEGQILKSHKGKNPVTVLVNNKKHPKNAQIILADKETTFDLNIQFKSGYQVRVKDGIRRITPKNIVIDPKEKRIGIIDGSGKIRPSRLTFRGQVFAFMKEKNYFINEYQGAQNWTDSLEERELEFAPYQTGASLQLYGLVLPKSPPPFEFRLDAKSPIATYSPVVTLKGRKAPTEDLRASKEGELLIHDNQADFIWNFKAPEKGTVNQNYLSLNQNKEDYFFSNRIFRAHKSAFSASAALSTSPTLDIVPGYNFTFDHWFEEIWGKGSWSYQRWGIKANVYETIQGFKPKDDFPENISVLPINFDLLYRFSPGVRPVQSSFGVGLRYMHFKLFRSLNEDVEAGLLGVGSFWHTAPQKIVDDVFNVVPFFRYPKWMELSFFYYPLIVGGQSAGFSFSWQARGQMFFARNWYLDASFNVNVISFEREKLSGVTLGADAFGIGTAHGTIGVGYQFN
jgi:hypothetical protein